jgi:hypothetical protein
MSLETASFEQNAVQSVETQDEEVQVKQDEKLDRR